MSSSEKCCNSPAASQNEETTNQTKKGTQLASIESGDGNTG